MCKELKGIATSVCGCTVHSRNYNPALKERDSTAAKLGGDYLKVENLVNVCKLNGSSDVFIISDIYQVRSFEGVDHLKVARKCDSKVIHSNSVSSSMHISGLERDEVICRIV